MKKLISMMMFVSACGGSASMKPMTTTPDTGANSGNVSQGQTPASTTLLAGAYVLQGATASGLLLVTDASNVLYSLDPATSTLTQIAPKADGGVTTLGDVVFVAHDLSQVNFNGPLGVWSPTTGYHELGVTAGSIANVYTDGTHIAYADHINFTTLASDLIVDVLDHSAPRTVFTNENYVGAQFAGTHLVVQHGDATTGTISSFDLVGTQDVTLATNAPTVSGNVNPAGTQVFTLDSTTNIAKLVSPTGTPIATLPSGITSVLFMADGATILAQGTGGVLEKLALADLTAAPEVIVPSDVLYLQNVSPDASWLLYETTFDEQTYTGDLWAAGISSASKPHELVTSGANYYASFSANSKYAAFLTDIDPSAYTGTLKAAALTDTTARALGTGVYNSDFVGANSIAFVSDVAVGSTETGELQLVDLSQTNSTPTTIAASVGVWMYTSPDGKTLYYNVQSSPNTNGIYSIAVN